MYHLQSKLFFRPSKRPFNTPIMIEEIWKFAQTATMLLKDLLNGQKIGRRIGAKLMLSIRTFLKRSLTYRQSPRKEFIWYPSSTIFTNPIMLVLNIETRPRPCWRNWKRAGPQTSPTRRNQMNFNFYVYACIKIY